MLPFAPRLFRRRRGKSRGQSIVEFALILPLFLLLFATVLDLGRIAAARVTVTNAAREGAFEAAKLPNSYQAGQPCPTPDPSGDIPKTNNVVCRTILESKGSFVSIAPSDVTMTCSVSGCPTGIGNTVQVSVVGHFNLLTPVMAAFFGGNTNVTFTASTSTQIETLPTPAPTLAPTPTPTPTPAGATPTPTPTGVPTPTPGCGAPSAGFTYTTAPPSDHAPLTLTVTDTSTAPASCPIDTWSWDFGDGIVLNGKNPGTHTYNAAGTYFVTLTVTSPGGSNTSGKVTIKVKS